jgi:hypothetical protein
MTLLSAFDLAAAITSCDLRAIAGHLAASALESARENGAGTGADEREAAENLDDWTRATDISGCSALVALEDRDIRSAARLAVALLEGRA